MNIKVKKLPSGLTCYVFPKKGYVEKQAALAVVYGSADLKYRVDGGETVEIPPGTAHFLEHKMFEQEELNLFNQFSSLGADVNAYTNLFNTSYYFTTNERFEENLQLLFHFMQNPHITHENVEKEKGIILQEIAMYRDDPQSRLYVNLMQGLFHESTVRYDILGTEESVNGIHQELLHQCYGAFYTPPNMVLVCAGDLEAERVFDLAEQGMQTGKPDAWVERFYGDEPPHTANAFVEAVMPVSMPMFEIGFKSLHQAEAAGKTAAAMQMLVDLIAGESSPLYASLYNEGLIDNQFGVAYIGGAFFGTSLFAGASPDPRRVEEALTNEINRIKAEGLCVERFELIKQKTIGRYLRSLNSLDTITASQTDLHAKGLDVFSYLNILNHTTIQDTEECLHHALREDGRALSVLWPS